MLILFRTLTLSIIAGFILQPSTSLADCSCSIGSNGIRHIGKVYQSNSCPSSSGTYTYDEYLVECSGGKIQAWLVGQQDLYSGTPEQIIQGLSGSSDKVLRNPEGTNIIMVQKLSYTFNGTIAGVYMPSRPAGVHQADPPERLNEFCMPFSRLADQDGDRFPECQDCNDNDAAQSYACEPCRQQYQDTIAECKGEFLILSFDYTTCVGECVNGNNGPPMCLQ